VLSVANASFAADYVSRKIVILVIEFVENDHSIVTETLIHKVVNLQEKKKAAPNQAGQRDFQAARTARRRRKTPQFPGAAGGVHAPRPSQEKAKDGAPGTCRLIPELATIKATSILDRAAFSGQIWSLLIARRFAVAYLTRVSAATKAIAVIPAVLNGSAQCGIPRVAST
jgi:hypothetical protein